MSNIIGQEDKIQKIDELIANNMFPRFVILYGERGCGKKEVAKYISSKLNASLVRPENDKLTVDYIRNIVEQAYKQTHNVVYLLPEIDNNSVSTQAKNALLKVTEEQPNNAYFIMTALDNNFVLSTLKSRAYSFWFNTYSPGLLKEFARERNIELEEDMYKVLKTPGDVLSMHETKKEQAEFYKFTDFVVDNIGEVTGANAFKIADKIAFNEDDEGYSLQNFWIVFKQVCLDRTKNMNNSKRNMYFSFIRITTQYTDKLRIRGINKKSLFDLWIIEIRDTYFKYN